MTFLSRAGWLTQLRLGYDEVPRLLVLEGTWWAASKAPRRLSRLEGVRELGLPGLHHGWYRGVPVVFAFVYGAARAVEPVHIFGEIGATPTVVLIGSCGGISPTVRTGDVVVPEQVVIEESTSASYERHPEPCEPPGQISLGPSLQKAQSMTQRTSGAVSADPALTTEACSLLQHQGPPSHCGTTVTTSALLTQTPEQIDGWAAAGLLGVDMEASAVYSAAAYFAMAATALLFCWDELSRGRSWTDPFSPGEKAAQYAADEATYATALEIGST